MHVRSRFSARPSKDQPLKLLTLPLAFPSRSLFSIEDGAAFFLDYISSDLVGVIAARHLHIADQQEDGTRDELCLELAALHSDAVDYPKTGYVSVVITIDF